MQGIVNKSQKSVLKGEGMPYPIEEKLVVAVASSALFALDEADTVFRKEGVRAYRNYQREHENNILAPGIAFPFVRRFLELNTVFPERQPVEVVLLSRNDSDTGMRVFNSIEHYKLGIIRAAFTRGNSPFRYIPAYNVSLFLSGNKSDVTEAICNGYPAGLVLPSVSKDDTDDTGLRVAFDFDGVIADDSAEKIFQAGGRVIRSEDDRGVLVLIDSRYDDPRYKKLFPEHWHGLKFTSNIPSLSGYLQRFWNSGNK